jgi:hypothetical protein
LGKVKSKIPNLSSDSGTSTGLSDVCWTRTTVGGPNYLGGSVTGSAMARNPGAVAAQAPDRGL